jgi:hypothetical protein
MTNRPAGHQHSVMGSTVRVSPALSPRKESCSRTKPCAVAAASPNVPSTSDRRVIEVDLSSGRRQPQHDPDPQAIEAGARDTSRIPWRTLRLMPPTGRTRSRVKPDLQQTRVRRLQFPRVLRSVRSSAIHASHARRRSSTAGRGMHQPRTKWQRRQQRCFLSRRNPKILLRSSRRSR